MLPELTPAVARAIDSARQWAHRAGSDSVQPIHLLQGLLEEEEGRAATLLSQAGVGLASLRQALEAAVAVSREAGSSLPGEAANLDYFSSAPQADQPRGAQQYFSSQTDAVLIRARELATDHTVSSESLLLALLQMDAKLRTDLEGRGLQFPDIEKEILSWSAGPPLELTDPLNLTIATERVDALRILDAAGNRAREALRVIEDYCRFVLDDAFLSRQLKQFRHDLVETLSCWSTDALCESRETLRDVGVSLSTPREQERHSMGAVLEANWKRLQEALRSLEEYGKLCSSQFGATVESFRYRSYTLERALVLGRQARDRLTDVRLYVLVSAAQCSAALDWTIQEAAAGGARMIQLREKKLTDRELLERARNVRRWTQRAGVLFILNDRPDVARVVDADGVHLGQEDLRVKEARRVLGPHALIGVSTHTVEQVKAAVLDGASYLGLGPTFPSKTKAFVEFAGLDFVRAAVAETSLPAFVLGGVNQSTIESVAAAGGRRVAVSHAVCQAEDPRQAAAELLSGLQV